MHRISKQNPRRHRIFTFLTKANDFCFADINKFSMTQVLFASNLCKSVDLDNLDESTARVNFQDLVGALYRSENPLYTEPTQSL